MDKEIELLQRKPTRLKSFDYSKNGVYFITICTENRKNILSSIYVVGEGSPLPQLSPFGKIVEDWIQKLPGKYPEISVDSYVIMPNHIHLLLSVDKDNGRGDPSPTVDTVIGWFKFQATKGINAACNKTGERVFQRSFFDHIIRNYDDYYGVLKYIYENPKRWYYDELYSEE